GFLTLLGLVFWGSRLIAAPHGRSTSAIARQSIDADGPLPFPTITGLIFASICGLAVYGAVHAHTVESWPHAVGTIVARHGEAPDLLTAMSGSGSRTPVKNGLIYRYTVDGHVYESSGLSPNFPWPARTTMSRAERSFFHTGQTVPLFYND